MSGSTMSEPAKNIRDAVATDLEAVIRLDEIHTGLAKPDYWRGMF